MTEQSPAPHQRSAQWWHDHPEALQNLINREVDQALNSTPARDIPAETDAALARMRSHLASVNAQPQPTVTNPPEVQAMLTRMQPTTTK